MREVDFMREVAENSFFYFEFGGKEYKLKPNSMKINYRDPNDTESHIWK